MTSYSTTFPTIENPISGGGHLITSTSPGVNWSGLGLGNSGTLPVAPIDVVGPGMAELVDYANPNYGDALAVVTGSWAPDQSASVVVGNLVAQPGGYPEFEIHLRTDPATGAGYEISWSYNQDYILVAAWNAHGGYTNLFFDQDAQYAVHPGDTLTASIVGNVITMYTNGVQIAQMTDHTFASGNPGFGFDAGSSGAAAYDISSFSASDSGTPPPPPPPPAAAPVISAFSPDINGVDTTSTVNLTGRAEAGSTVSVFDGSINLGSTTVDTNGNWGFTENNAVNGTHVFTATDTDANGTSAASSPFDVVVNVAGSPPPPPPPNNIVSNGDFETGDFSSWRIGGHNKYQTFITTDAESGNYAADLGTEGTEGTLSQTLKTTVGQQYELTFWLANLQAGNVQNFYAIVGGQTLYSEVNPQAHGYVEHVIDFTATSSTTRLIFEYRNDPSDWHLDDVSVVGIAAASHLT